MIGPGVYDAIAAAVREVTHAQAVCVIVINGDRGCGFSVQSDHPSMLVISDVMKEASAAILSDHEEIQRGKDGKWN